MMFQLMARLGDDPIRTPVGALFGTLFLLLLAGYTVYQVWDRNRTMKMYEDAYAAFVADPLDSTLREHARECANRYASSLLKPVADRNLQRTTFLNEIENIYRTAKGQEKLRQKMVKSKPPSSADRLGELQKMMDKGLISDEEFQTKRAQILNEV